MRLNSRRKGRRGEVRVVRAYQNLDAWNASRASAVLEAMHETPTGCDVRAWCDTLRVAIQVRHQARPNVWDALADAEAGAVPGELAVAHVTRTHPGSMQTERVVVLSEDAWLALMQTWSGSVSDVTAIAGNGATVRSGRPDQFMQGRQTK